MRAGIVPVVRFWLALVVAACMLARVGADEPAKTRTVTAGPVKLTVPEGWKQKEKTNRFRLAQFSVPKVAGEKEDAEFVVFFFGAGGGGGVDANVHRWINQFQSQGRTVKLVSGKSAQGDYVLADLSGTWNKPIGPPVMQKTVEMTNARVLSVILTAKDQANYFLRLTGPAKTVSANADAFRAAFGADQKSEQEYKLPDDSGS